MKMRNLFLGVALAPPLVGAVVLGFLVKGDPLTRVEIAAAMVVLSAAIFILVYALFQRYAENGPPAELWTSLLIAAGGLAVAGRIAAGLPLHSDAGIALSISGPILAIVGTLLYGRARRARTPATE